MPAWVTCSNAHDVALLNELQERVEAEDGRADGPREVPADRRGEVVAQDVGEAQHGDLGARIVLGEVADEAVRLDQCTFHTVLDRTRPRRVLVESVRVTGGGAVDQRRGLDDDVTYRGTGGPCCRQEIHGPDDVDLVHGPPRYRRGVCDHEGVEDRVDLRRPHDPVHDGVGLVGPDELGSFEGDRRCPCPHAENHVHCRVGLERLDHPPPQKVSAPVTRTRRLTNASAEPDAAPVAQHVVDRFLEQRANTLGLLHDPALRIPVLVRRERRIAPAPGRAA